MRKKIIAAVVLGLFLIVGFGCAKKEPATNKSASEQLPAGHPDTNNFGSMDQGKKAAKPVNAEEVSGKIETTLKGKFAGEWSVSGTTLKKGDYTENDSYKIVDEVANTIYPGSMVSIFIGEERISSSVANKDQNGKRVLTGYPTPKEVGETMKSGKANSAQGSSMGSVSYQKVFLPLKSAAGKTVAVMSVSLPQ